MTARELTRPYEPNPALRAVYKRFFDQIQVDDAWVQAVRQLASEGAVVYVLRNLNFIDFLALDYLTKRYRLPQIQFVNDLRLWVLNPMGKGWLNAIWPKRNVSLSEELEDALSRGGSAALFLKRPPGVLDVAAGASGGRGLKEGDELVRTLFEVQRRRQTPILLVPQVFVWTKYPDTRGTEPLDFVLGPREWPSPVRTFAQFFYNYKNVQLKLGEPINLVSFLQSANGLSDAALVRRLTYAVLGRLERERRAVTGPAEKPPERVRQEIVRSPKLRHVIEDLADGRTDRHEHENRAHEMLRELQATPDRTTIKMLEITFDRLFTRLYAGLEFEQSDIERIRHAAREGTLILLPSHKSHIDYLVLSYIFNKQNLPLPVIAAGDNLNFFPVGRIFRRGGAFFIRRSFRGDRLYAAVVDAALALPERRVFFVPVSIGYERLVEGRAYESELLGGEKSKEDAAGLLKSREVLRHRYGRINMQAGQILTFDDIRQDLGIAANAPLSPAKRRSLVTRLGNRVMDEINRVTAATPGALTALVLLTHDQRGILHSELIERAAKLLDVLIRLGARTSPTLSTPSGALRPESIREACQMFADAELVEIQYPDDPTRDPKDARAGEGASYVVPQSKRLALDTSKNIMVHFFVERALVGIALLSGGGDAEIDWVRERVQALSRLFKFEFRFRADAPFADIFDETVKAMTLAGEVEIQGDRMRPGAGRDGWQGVQWLKLYSSILRGFLEGYLVAARSLDVLLKVPHTEKDLVKKAITIGQRMFLAGDIERAEAVSKPILQNAFQAFVDHGYLVLRDNKLDLSEVGASGDALQDVERRMRSYIPDVRA